MAALIPIFLNGWKSTVQAGSTAIGSATATGINVATGDGAKLGTIGTNQYVPMVVTDSSGVIKEYVWGTAVATDTLTVTRQAEDSSRFAASTTSIQSGYSIYAVASSTALNWMTFARTAPGPMIYTSGRYISSIRPGTISTAIAATTGLFAATPLWIPKQITADRIAVNNQTTNASGQARLGIHAADANGFPAGLILDAGLVTTSATGDQNITISQVLPAGLYWIGISSSHALNFYGATEAQLAHVIGSTSLATSTVTCAWYSHTYSSALISSPTWNLSSGGSVLVHLRLV